jgi:3-oxoacyl-[acyl-carrier protein] reductase
MEISGEKRVIVITGASRGLGSEIALRFGRSGNRVVVNYLQNKDAAAAVVDVIIRNGGDAFAFQADIRKTNEVNLMVASAIAKWNCVDVLVNNAGITRDRLVLRMSEHDWDEVMGINLTGTFHCIRAVSPVMLHQGKGHIISIASIVALQGREGQANYSASKAGLIGLSKAVARELGHANVKVNVVVPGYMPTAMGMTVSDVVHDRIIRDNALQRASHPAEVADFIYHLSLMENVSGQVFNIDSRVV